MTPPTATPAAPTLAARQQLTGHITREMAAAPVVERVLSDTALSITIGLPVKDRAAMKDAVMRLYDPKSASFHRYLTPQQFGEQFGAAVADYQTVVAWARANHLTVAMHPNRLVVRVFGTAGALETALNIHFNYATRPDGTRFRTPDREPSLSLSIPIEHIGNLDDFFVALPSQCSATNKWPVSGQDLRNAYLDGGGANGAGQTVAIDSAGGCFIQGDVDEFAKVNGLGRIGFKQGAVVSVDTDSTGSDTGKMLECPANQVPGGETTMDIECVTAMAPAATIQLVSGSGRLFYYTTHPAISQITVSHGAWITATDATLLAELAAQGQSYFYASGDGGAYAIPSEQEHVENLAQQEWVTVVGGTVLTMSGSKYDSEAGWGGGGGGVMSSGGGALPGFPMPRYQASINPLNSQLSGVFRNAPDVSAVAYNINLVRTEKTEPGQPLKREYCYGGGTSTSAPLWGGFMALVNQRAERLHQRAIGFANVAFYAVPWAFHDVKHGANPTHACKSYRSTKPASCLYVDATGAPQTAPASCACYTAEPGYDQVTGLGTPTAYLIDALTKGSSGPCDANAPPNIYCCKGVVLTCGTASCGLASNPCGGSKSCGSCGSGYLCYNGNCIPGPAKGLGGL